jgi:hypothetical protein
MKNYEATERAFKNGYEKGYETAKAEVIRCAECRHYNTDGCGDGFGWCEFLNVGMMNGCFCSHAERPEKANITERTKDAMHKMGKAAHGG